MEIYDFLSTRKESLFQKTDASLRDLIPGFIDMRVIPVLNKYQEHVENTPEPDRLSAEKFLDNHPCQESFIDFKCYWSMIALMGEWVGNNDASV